MQSIQTWISIYCCCNMFIYFDAVVLIDSEWAGFSSVPILKIDQSSMEGVWKTLHRFSRLLQSCRLLWCVGLCEEQVSANTIDLVRLLINLKCTYFGLITSTFVYMEVTIACASRAISSWREPQWLYSLYHAW